MITPFAALLMATFSTIKVLNDVKKAEIHKQNTITKSVPFFTPARKPVHINGGMYDKNGEFVRDCEVTEYINVAWIK